MKKKRKWLKVLLVTAAALIAAAVAVFSSLNAAVKNSGDIYMTGIDDIEGLKNADCIIVLGAKVYSDESLSPILNDRVDYAIRLYKAGKAKKLLLSGDHGQTDYDEVNAMMTYAIQQGVPSEDIFLDHAGFSTYETMVRARDVFCVKSAIVVTQKFHLYRAVYIARALGLDAYGVNSDPRRYMYEQRNEMRESLARVKDFLYVNIFHPDPTYLGEKIPITGDGALTHDRD